MPSLRGKLTRHKSTPVREDAIKIPEELILQNWEIDLCIDIMYVNCSMRNSRVRRANQD
jgi:hypothetical protein